MYESQDIANRIKTHAKSKGIRLKQMLSDCKLGINTISQMSKGMICFQKILQKSPITWTVPWIICSAGQITQK